MNLSRNLPLNLAFILATAVGTDAFAQNFDGLYHPNWGQGSKWICAADYVGSDGGAMQIKEGQLFDVETYCSLNDPREINGTEIVKYTASCSVEGSTLQSTVFLAPYDKGVLKADDNGIADWRSCNFVTEQNDPSFFIGPSNFLGQRLDFNNLLGQDLTPLYWYSHGLCRGTIPSWPEAISDNACELRQSISDALLAKGFGFDRSEQIWIQTSVE